jgi:FlaA1/EpsC-like NDP-sugar epimerase
VVDGLLVAFAYYLAFWLRLDGFGAAKNHYSDLLAVTIGWVVPVTLLSVAAFGAYQRLWKFVSQREMEAVVKGVLVATVLIVGAIAVFHPVLRPGHPSSAVTLPGGVITLFFLLSLAFLVGSRVLVHLAVEGRLRNFRTVKGARQVLIVGGGDAGRLIVRELVRNPQLGMRPIGFVDDDPRKLGVKDDYGLKVLGTTFAEDLARVLDNLEPDEVVIAIPSAPGRYGLGSWPAAASAASRCGPCRRCSSC